MASNAGEQGAAFQGAELALRTAEAEIRNSTSSGPRFTTKYPGSATDPDSLRRTVGSEGFDTTCFGGGINSGLCLLTVPCGSVQACATARATKATAILTGANANLYNTLPFTLPDGTVVPALPGINNQPRWVIDFSCEPVPGNSNCQYTYVITAMGFGNRLSTQVTLEAMFRGI
jgi:Tfp pilus assembly protein PilX